MQDEAKKQRVAAELAKIKARQAQPLPAVPKVEPREKPMSVGGFAENTLNDAYDFLKGLASLPGALYRGGKFVVENIDKPDALGQGASDLGSALVDAIIDPYRKHGVGVLYHRPLTSLLDAVTIATLGGGAVARVGKLAGGVSRATLQKVAGVTGKAGEVAKARLATPVSTADKLVAIGERVRDFPGKLARKGVDKAVLKASGGKWDLAKRREFLQNKAEQAAIAAMKVKADMEAVGKRIAALSDEEQALWHKWRTQGATQAELAAAPKVAEALETYRGLADEWRKILKENNLLNDAQAANALAAKYAAEVKGGRPNADEIAKARAAIEAAEVKPVYGPALFESGADINLDNILTVLPKVAQGAGKVNFLEKFTGASGAIKDPRIYVPRAIAGFRAFESRLTLAQRLLQSPHLIKNAAFTEAFTPPATGVFNKYYNDRIRADAVRSITDPTIQRLLRWEYTRSPFPTLTRLYDRILGLFRRSGTLWNPRWYVGNAVGDAILGTLAGGGPFEPSFYRGIGLRQRGAMPPQILGSGGMHGVQGATSRLLERASEIGNQVDIATRAGIVTRAVAQDLKNTGLSFEASAEVMESVLRSTQQFSDVQVKMQLAQEQVARSSRTVAAMDRRLAGMSANERKLAGELQDARDRNVARGLAPAVGGKPIAAPGAAPDPAALKAKRVHAPKRPLAVQPRDLRRMEEELAALRQQIVNLDTRRDLIVRDLADNASTIKALEAQIPGLAQQNAIARDAVARANAFIGDYLGLDGFEQGVMRRLVPFYPWSKAMTMLAFRLPFLAAPKAFAWNRFSAALMSQVGDPELPEYMRDYIPVFARQNGDTVWLKFGSYSPFNNLRVSRFADVPIPNLLAFHEQNPMISLAVRMVGGKTMFEGSKVPYGEPIVNVSNGDVYEFTPQGTLRKTIPQTPLISGVAHMFPTTQLLENLIAPFAVTKRNWYGYPQPVLNPDGSYKYPKELLDRLGPLAGLSVATRNREEMIRSERIKVRMAILAMRKAYRRADPDEREYLRTVLEDYQRGEFRRIEAN